MARLAWRTWWQRLTGPIWRIVMTVEAADEVPERLAVGSVVLVQSGEIAKWLIFDCPCGGHRILLNLDRSRWPYWRFQQSHALSVWPSVDFEGPSRRCHYILRRGHVFWVKDRSRYGRRGRQ